MKCRYLDMENINHLLQQSDGGGIYQDSLWRESYYFNMTDPKNQLSLITTIGFLPNKRRSAGFLLIIKDRKPVFLKPLISLRRPVFSGYEFQIGQLSYSIQGTDWRLRYEDRKLSMDLRFSPINKIFPYRTKLDEEWPFERIGTQHFEQFGAYKGYIELSGKGYDIGPCYGHRDHSWGIRDWGSVDRYSLHCCAFSEDLAFNLWEGSIRGRSFSKGFLFGGEDNSEIVDHVILADRRDNRDVPDISNITIRDSKNRTFEIQCKTVVSVPFPPPGALVHEGIGRMTLNDEVGYGLSEYLVNSPGIMSQLPSFFKLLTIGGRF